MHMTSEGSGEIFEDEFADMCTKIIPPGVMVGRLDVWACADMGARTPTAPAEIKFINLSMV